MNSPQKKKEKAKPNQTKLLLPSNSYYMEKSKEGFSKIDSKC